jgi:L-asparagine transporter-like permease
VRVILAEEIGEQREAGLQQGLSKRQLVMIGLGGAIGTGLFMGSGLAIGYAGPAVLISYLIAGFIAIVMVLSLSEMAVMHPSAGSFGLYAETYISPWIGFLVRYTYWFAQVIALGGEAVAAGVYMTYWFPEAPVWMWSIGFAAILLYINTRSVANFGSIEYVFALIKVTAIVFFIIIGFANLLGWFGLDAVGFGNLTQLPGGFLPHGLKGMWMGVIIGLFSFVGIELIAVASGEAKDPRRAIPAALRSMALRLLLFYLLALTVVVAFVPWTETGVTQVAQSPFVRVMAQSGIAHAAGLMNFVVISAALSSMNTNIYLCSRMLFSLSRGGYAPKLLGRLNRAHVPMAATLLSGFCILTAASLSKFTPLAYNYLQAIALLSMILVWVTILVSHLRFRQAHRGQTLPLRTPFFPYMQILGLALLGGLLVTMALDQDYWSLSWIVGIPWLAGLSAAYFIWKTRHTPVVES